MLTLVWRAGSKDSSTSMSELCTLANGSTASSLCALSGPPMWDPLRSTVMRCVPRSESVLYGCTHCLPNLPQVDLGTWFACCHGISEA